MYFRGSSSFRCLYFCIFGGLQVLGVSIFVFLGVFKFEVSWVLYFRGSSSFEFQNLVFQRDAAPGCSWPQYGLFGSTASAGLFYMDYITSSSRVLATLWLSFRNLRLCTRPTNSIFNFDIRNVLVNTPSPQWTCRKNNKSKKQTKKGGLQVLGVLIFVFSGVFSF